MAKKIAEGFSEEEAKAMAHNLGKAEGGEDDNEDVNTNSDEERAEDDEDNERDAGAESDEETED